jgi:hypothetical protein
VGGPVADYARLGVRLPGDPPGLVLPLSETRVQVADRLIRENGLGDQRRGAGDGGAGRDYYADVPPVATSKARTNKRAPQG